MGLDLMFDIKILIQQVISNALYSCADICLYSAGLTSKGCFAVASSMMVTPKLQMSALMSYTLPQFVRSG